MWMALGKRTLWTAFPCNEKKKRMVKSIDLDRYGKSLAISTANDAALTPPRRPAPKTHKNSRKAERRGSESRQVIRRLAINLGLGSTMDPEPRQLFNVRDSAILARGDRGRARVHACTIRRCARARHYSLAVFPEEPGCPRPSPTPPRPSSPRHSTSTR
jgi:hypothetical protein